MAHDSEAAASGEITFYCPNPTCGTRLRAPAHAQGHHATCPECGTSVAVPRPAKATEVKPVTLPEAEDAASSPPAILGFLLAMLAIGLVVAAVLGGKQWRLKVRGIRAPEASQTESPPKAGEPPARIELKLALKPGRYVATETQDAQGRTTATMGGRTRETETRSSLTVAGDLEVQPADPSSGERRVLYTCTRVEFATTREGQTRSFDSQGKAAAQDVQLAVTLAPLLGWRATQVHSADGRLVRQEGLDRLLAEIGAGGTRSAAEAKALLEPLLKDVLTRGWVKLLPAGPVSPGDTWRTEAELDLAAPYGTMKFDFSCHLKSVEEGPAGKIAVLQCDGVAEARDRKLDTAAMDLPEATRATAEELKSHLTLTIRFDTGIGLATRVRGEAKNNGELAMQAPGGLAIKATTSLNVQMDHSLLPK